MKYVGIATSWPIPPRKTLSNLSDPLIYLSVSLSYLSDPQSNFSDPLINLSNPLSYLSDSMINPSGPLSYLYDSASYLPTLCATFPGSLSQPHLPGIQIL